MKLGVYICDRGQQPTRLRELDSHVKETYIIGRPTETHSPEIALHHGKISKRHLILIHEDPGYWTASSLGKNCNTLRSPTKGKVWTVIIRPTHSPPAEQDEAIAQLLQSPA